MNSPVMTRARASALLFGGVLGSLASPAGAQTGTALRLAVQPVENAMEVFYAQDTGRFSAAGIDANIQILQSASAITAAVASNTFDVGYTTVDVLAAAHQRGLPLVVIAPATEFAFPATERISALVVAGDSPVNQAKDLDGKVIATPGLRGIGETTLRAWIDQNGGDSSTIKFVEIPFPAELAALDAARIDAVWMAEPFLSGMSKSHRVLGYAFSAVSKHFLLSAFFTTAQWAKARPDLVNRFATVIRDTAIWANKNPESSGAILSKYAKLDPAIVATMARSRYAEQLTPALMQPLIDVSAKYNGYAPFPARDLMSRT